MGDLSAHFSRREFDCHDGSPADPSPRLVEALEQLRSIVGNKPIRIVSGYRSPAYNRRIGGAKRSQHMANRAADLERGVATRLQARRAGFTGIGYCGQWAVHVDVRPSPVVVEFEDC